MLARRWNRQRSAQLETGPSWREGYEAWHRALPPVDEPAEAPWHRLVRRYLDPVRDIAGRAVLEVACGRGAFARWLAAAGPAKLVAADFAETAIRRAAATAGPVRCVRWIVADIEVLPFPSATFETVICCETVEHVSDPARAVGELARVLKPGGRLFLTAPNYLGPMGAYRVYLRLTGRRYRESGQPFNRATTLPRLRWWVGRSGLSVETVDAVGAYCPWPGRPPVELAGAFGRLWPRWTGLHALVVARK